MGDKIVCCFCEESFFSSEFFEEHIREKHTDDIDIVKELLDAQFRLERITVKVCEYAETILSLEADKREQAERLRKFEKLLFDAAGFIAHSKKPTTDALLYTNTIFEVLTYDLWPGIQDQIEKVAKMREKEARIGLQQAHEARKGT